MNDSFGKIVLQLTSILKILFRIQQSRIAYNLKKRMWVKMVVIKMLVVDQSKIWLSSKILDTRKNLALRPCQLDNFRFWLMGFKSLLFYKKRF